MFVNFKELQLDHLFEWWWLSLPQLGMRYQLCKQEKISNSYKVAKIKRDKHAMNEMFQT